MAAENWWSRNWIWVLPVGCLGAIVGTLAFGLSIVLLVFSIMRQSSVFQEALEAVRDDRRVAAALGEPIEPGWWLLGNLNTSGPSGTADLMFPVSGPQGSATVYLAAQKEAGEWYFDILEVEIKGEAERIDLLEPFDTLEADRRNHRRRPPPVAAAPPLLSPGG